MLKRIIKDYLIPPGFIKIKNRLFHAKASSNVYNRLFMNMRRETEDCIILASGPSIANVDFNLLRNVDAIAVSLFHVHKEAENLKILHHVLAPQHDPFTFDDSLKIFRLFKDRYSKLRPHILLGIREYKYGYDKLLTRYPEYDCFDYSYVYFDNSPELWDDNFMDDSVWDLRQRPFGPRTVIYTAIQLAVFLGYKRIFLFGVDHNYILDVSKTTDLHFYPDAVGIDDRKHLEKYFDKEAWFFEYYKRWHQYKLMNQYCTKKGISIFNCSEGSYLDVFPSIDVRTFINMIGR